MAATAETLHVGDTSLAYLRHGRGPGLLVPWCNFPWPDMQFVNTLAERFTVVMASPRGYQRSSRLDESQEYRADFLVQDLLAVCDHTGLESFSVLGYSLTAAIAGWLAAAASTRVAAVALGGFPLLGSYEAVFRGAEATASAISRDEKAAAALRTDFDPRAVLTFYGELAARPDDALIDLACPVLAFWGTHDDILQSFDTTEDFGCELSDRGVTTLPLEGRDHVSAILGLGDVIDDLTGWLERV